MISNPYQPLVPGLDGPMEGLLVANGAAGKVKVAAGVIGLVGAMVEQSAADAADLAKEIDCSGLADGKHLIYVNHPDAKAADGTTALAKFTAGVKEEYVPVTNIINNTKGELVGRSKVLAEITVATGAVTAISNKARYELKHFQGHFTQQMPGGLQVDNVNLER